MKNNKEILIIFAMSIVFVLSLFVWQGSQGFDLWDEGFLWYGVQRVLLGEVPIRDFMAYDPGRYYLYAILANTIDNLNLITLRASGALIQIFGLFFGVYLVVKNDKEKSIAKYLFLIMAMSILVLWMSSRHKIIDITISIFQIGVICQLIELKNIKSYAVTGIWVGFIAFFGRNHAVYGAISSLLAIAWLEVYRGNGVGVVRGVLCWTGGVIIGFSPIIIMTFVVPGFAVSYWESIRFLFEIKATNLTLPVPWPWRVNFTNNANFNSINYVLVGLFFVGVLSYSVISLLWLFAKRDGYSKLPPVYIASVFLSVPYAHYAFSRADVEHLVHGVFPMLIGALTLLVVSRPMVKWTLTCAFFATSLCAMILYQPGWRCMEINRCVNVEISGKSINVDANVASEIALIRYIADRYAPDGRTFIAAPFWPGAYAILQRKSPMWEIYALFPRSSDFQKLEIERIKKSEPAFAIVFDFPLDDRDDLRFKNTHKLINAYIVENSIPLSNLDRSEYNVSIFKVKTHE
jgi:hypothetical protein